MLRCLAISYDAACALAFLCEKNKSPHYVAGATLPVRLRKGCVAACFQKELATQCALKRDAADQARKEAMEKEAAARKKAVHNQIHFVKAVVGGILCMCTPHTNAGNAELTMRNCSWECPCGGHRSS